MEVVKGGVRRRIDKVRAEFNYNLATGSRDKYKKTGAIKSLQDAIRFSRRAIQLLSPDHPECFPYFNTLSATLVTRFEITGMMDDLEESISCGRYCLELCPLDHGNRPFFLSDLAYSIHVSYKQTGRMEDLYQAIQLHLQSLKLHRIGDPDRDLSLNNLGASFSEVFRQTGRLEDLEQSINYDRLSLGIRPPGHASRPTTLNNLAAAIMDRYTKFSGSVEDMEESIQYNRESLQLRPPGNSERFMSLLNLGSSLYTRGKMGDLEEAAGYFWEAEASLYPTHAFHTFIKQYLGEINLRKHGLDPTNTGYLAKAFKYFEDSANHLTTSPKSRFEAAIRWAVGARQHRHESALRAYSISLTLLNQILVATPTVESQHKSLLSLAHIPKSLAQDAASWAIELGRLDVAVELLEQGRAILWSKLRGFRHPLVELREVDRALADKFESLGVELEGYAMSSELDPLVRNHAPPVVPSKVQQRTYHQISDEWNRALEKIRELDGFQDFLGIVPFSTLRKAATEGPIIVVNVCEHRSDAIIVRENEPPVLVPLPKATRADLARLSSQFIDPRASTAPDFSMKMRPVLRALWHTVVHPITERLAELGVEENTRIWWCPTSELCALPLHAAGPYLPREKALPDLYICSYTPTLSALITARSNMTRSTAIPKFLVIGQPDDSLPTVEEEVRRIKQFGDFDVLIGEQARRDTVISGLKQHSWTHFACHGHRDTHPFHSSFKLHADERLELLHLIKARLPDAELAFVSACHGAAADVEGAPDEVIHLAAALQFCGFRSVVGTLWAMADEDAPDVSEDFYRHMFRESGRVDVRDAATAINLATKAMRRRKGMTLGRWVNFIHIGV